MSVEPKGLEHLNGTDQERIGTQYPMQIFCDHERGGFLCTRPDGHDGPHVAHGGRELAFAWWPAEDDALANGTRPKTETA